jgi:dienelactone hydrolase
MKSNRRNFIRLTGLTGLSLAGAGFTSQAGSKKELRSGMGTVPQREPDAFVPLNRFPQMVHEYFVRRLRQVEEEGNRRRAGIRTREDAEAYVREVCNKVKQCFGTWPEKTPLNARVTKKTVRDAYTIENVIFESRPGYPVTANLYIPRKRKGQFPAVVGVCGHNDNGKAGNQSFAQGLARLGYVAIVYDPIGQGERVQYITGDLKSKIGFGVLEHLYAGNQLFLTGESLSAWSAWDGIRAVDYLLTRKEVDPRYIGVTGVSGGGTQTTWICSADPRINMAAPACFINTFRRNLENEEVADTEQCPTGALALGLDHSDFLAAMAPKPVIILSQENDFFDVRGAEESYNRLKPLYRLLGYEQNIRLSVGPGGHSYPKASREEMYSMFNMAANISGPSTEPPLITEKQETLWCTPNGQVGESAPRTVFSFSEEFSRSLRAERKILRDEDLRQAVVKALKMPAAEGIPDFRIFRVGQSRGYPKRFAASYAVETEPGIFAFVYRLNDTAIYSRPPRGISRAVLYISHLSADDELRNEPLLAELIKAEPESAIFTCDVRGIGESKPNSTRKTFTEPYGTDYFYAVHSIMLDNPYPGQKTFDILRVIEWLKSFGHNEIHLAARGWGSIPSTFAALLSDDVVQVTLKNALTSYSDVAESEEYNWPLSSFVPGVLRMFDLPDCYNALSSKRLRHIAQWDARAGK